MGRKAGKKGSVGAGRASRATVGGHEQDVAKCFSCKKILGTGLYGTVRLGSPIKKAGQPQRDVDTVAVKTVTVDKADRRFEKAVAMLANEVKALKLMKGHAHCVQLVQVHEKWLNDRFRVDIVTDACHGGELYDFVGDAGVPSRLAKSIVGQILRGLQPLHAAGMMHRDIKTRNVMLEAPPGADGEVYCRLIDYGLALVEKDYVRDTSLLGFTGSEAYVSPEAQERFYSMKGDSWSVGVVMWELLFGGHPFAADTADDMLGMVRMYGEGEGGCAEPLRFPSERKGEQGSQPVSVWAETETQEREWAEALLSALLHPEAAYRPTATEALEHPWFTGSTPSPRPPTLVAPQEIDIKADGIEVEADDVPLPESHVAKVPTKLDLLSPTGVHEVEPLSDSESAFTAAVRHGLGAAAAACSAAASAAYVAVMASGMREAAA